jgi:multidrug efflux pump subunit AcrA (membrane-fusion protein)
MTSKQILTTAVLLLIGLLPGCSKETTKQKAAKPVKVKAVETHSSLSDVRYSASIEPAAQVEVAFKVAGYIDAIAREKDPAGQ